MDLARDVLTAVLWLGAGLLVYAGGTKLVVPDAAMAALHRLHLPSGRVAARVLGLGEIAVGAVIVVAGGLVGAVVSLVTYLALTGVSLHQRAAQVDCGCFGVRRYPIPKLHIAVDAGLAVVSLAAVAAPPLPLAEVGADAGVLALLAGAVLVATGVALVTAMTERAGLAEAANL
ncbi:MauE/DoxX family redox-associated membrane protein [Euzebya sp.]|uniref:MauE/DoxX family redox-associated membrane protein n=1 Tax=Euzebya sp. TaxID=1971409 RepID=UPI003510F29C